MKSSLNISLTDELRAFIDENCGDGTLFATPSEFVRDLLRQKKAETEAERLRQKIIEGYADAAHGRLEEFKGDLRSLIRSR